MFNKWFAACAAAGLCFTAGTAGAVTPFEADVTSSIDKGIEWLATRGAYNNPSSAGEAAGLALLALLEKRQAARGLMPRRRAMSARMPRTRSGCARRLPTSSVRWAALRSMPRIGMVHSRWRSACISGRAARIAAPHRAAGGAAVRRAWRARHDLRSLQELSASSGYWSMAPVFELRRLVDDSVRRGRPCGAALGVRRRRQAVGRCHAAGGTRGHGDQDAPGLRDERCACTSAPRCAATSVAASVVMATTPGTRRAFNRRRRARGSRWWVVRTSTTRVCRAT